MEKNTILVRILINHVFIIPEKLNFFRADNVVAMNITLVALLAVCVKKDAEQESTWQIYEIH